MTTPDPVKAVERLEELLAKATPGPWIVSGVRQKWRSTFGEYDSHAVGPDDSKGWVALIPYDEKNHAEDFSNAKLIAEAITALPALLADYRTLTKLVAEREEWVMVPREPTREMWAAMGNAVVGLQARQNHSHDAMAEAVYQAALAGAPLPPAPLPSDPTS